MVDCYNPHWWNCLRTLWSTGNTLVLLNVVLNLNSIPKSQSFSLVKLLLGICGVHVIFWSFKCSTRLEQYTKESINLIGGTALGLCGVQVTFWSS